MSHRAATRTVVYNRKSQAQVKQALYALLFAVLIGALFMYRWTIVGELTGGEGPLHVLLISVIVVLFVGVLLFLISSAYHLYNVLNSSPALVVDEEGFTDEVSLISLGRVEWNAVDDLKLIEVYGIPQLYVSLKVDALTRELLWVLDLRKSHGAIPITKLDGDVDEIVAAFESRSGIQVRR